MQRRLTRRGDGLGYEIYPVVVRVEAIVGVLIAYKQRDQDGRRKSQGETQNVDRSVGTVAYQVTKCCGEVVLKHTVYNSAPLTKRPSSMCTTRSARLAWASECVTMTMVVPDF